VNIQELYATLKRFTFGSLTDATNGDYPEQEYSNDRRTILANQELYSEEIVIPNNTRA